MASRLALRRRNIFRRLVFACARVRLGARACGAVDGEYASRRWRAGGGSVAARGCACASRAVDGVLARIRTRATGPVRLARLAHVAHPRFMGAASDGNLISGSTGGFLGFVMPALYFFLPFSFAKRSFRSFFADARNDPPPPLSAPTPSASAAPSRGTPSASKCLHFHRPSRQDLYNLG